MRGEKILRASLFLINDQDPFTPSLHSTSTLQPFMFFRVSHATAQTTSLLFFLIFLRHVRSAERRGGWLARR
jgi:hypothetical protein